MPKMQQRTDTLFKLLARQKRSYKRSEDLGITKLLLPRNRNKGVCRIHLRVVRQENQIRPNDRHGASQSAVVVTSDEARL